MGSRFPVAAPHRNRSCSRDADNLTDSTKARTCFGFGNADRVSHRNHFRHRSSYRDGHSAGLLVWNHHCVVLLDFFRLRDHSHYVTSACAYFRTVPSFSTDTLFHRLLRTQHCYRDTSIGITGCRYATFTTAGVAFAAPATAGSGVAGDQQNCRRR